MEIDLLKWEVIYSIDLSFIKDRLRSKLNWSDERIAKAILRYKQYLYIISEEKNGVCPTPDVDQVWHDHILHTKKYAEHCQIIFGKFLHHHPFANNDEKDQSTSKMLSDLGPQYFGDNYPIASTEKISVDCCTDDSECCSAWRNIQVE